MHNYFSLTCCDFLPLACSFTSKHLQPFNFSRLRILTLPTNSPHEYDARWAHVHYTGPEAYEVTAMAAAWSLRTYGRHGNGKNWER